MFIAAWRIFGGGSMGPLPSPRFGTPLLLLTVLAVGLSVSEGRGQSTAVPMLTEADRLDLIPASEGLASSNPYSGNNQIARRGRSWVVIFDGTDGQIWMSVAEGDAPEGRDFRHAFPLVGKANAVLPAGGDASDGNILVDPTGRLHLFWREKSLRHAICETRCLDSLQNIATGASWRTDREASEAAPDISELGDVWIDSSGVPWVCFTAADGVYVATSQSGRWQSKRVAEGKHPSAFLDLQGNLHLAFEHDRRIRYTRVDTRKFELSGPEDVAYGLVFCPRVVVTGGHPLIVYQVEGVKRTSPSPIDPGATRDKETVFIPPRIESRLGDYNESREGAGASIAFAFGAAEGWQRGSVARAEEIPVRIASLNDTNSGEVRPMVEELWHPMLSLDRHGVPWVFWSNTTRLHTYFSRWLGKSFTEPLECRGPFYNLSWAVGVERQPPVDSSEIGILTVASRRLYFGRVPVPPLEPRHAQTFPVLDLLNFSEVVRLEHRLGSFERYPGNPLFGGPGRPKEERATFPNVRFDGKKFWMEFSRSEPPTGTFPPLSTQEIKPPSVSVGRWASRHWLATSEDGLHWVQPRKDVYRYEGPALGDRIYWVTYFRDEAEPDASRRFKGVVGEGHWINNDERRVVYSPDGVRWTAGEKAINAEFMMEQGGPSYRDPYDIEERRFKSVCRSLGILGGRALGMMYSADLVHWSGAEPRLNPGIPYAGPRTTPVFWRGRLMPRLLLDSLGERFGEQIYWGTVWLENGIYMCLYASMPYDGGYEVSLAASRDGLHFYRIKNGQRILPRGVGGEWDSGSIASTSVPILRGDELWYYYGGRLRHHGVEKYNLEEYDGIGLAKLRRDGWAYLQIANPEAKDAHATTVSFDRKDVEGKELFLNVAGVGSGQGVVRVEVLDAETGKPQNGLGGAETATLTAEGVEVPVRWRRGSHLEPILARRVKFRFYVQGLAVRLYAYTLK